MSAPLEGVKVVEVAEGVAGPMTGRLLGDAGADVVGLNCQRGPKTLMPIVKRVREAVSCHVAALPVPYRTTESEPTFQTLTDRACNCIPGGRPFPTALDPFTCNRYECAEFARECLGLDVRYIGLCCGAAPHHIRAVAEAVGRKPPGSRYSPDMSKHAFFGTDRVSLTLTSRAPGVTVRTRTYARLHDVVKDVDWARVLVGFHFRNSDLQGSALGRKIGRYVARNYFQRLG